jgi:hypothetical protein
MKIRELLYGLREDVWDTIGGVVDTVNHSAPVQWANQAARQYPMLGAATNALNPGNIGPQPTLPPRPAAPAQPQPNLVRGGALQQQTPQLLPPTTAYQGQPNTPSPPSQLGTRALQQQMQNPGTTPSRAGPGVPYSGRGG